MKKLLLSALFLTVSFSSLFSQQKPVVIQPTFDVTDAANRALYEQYIENHPFSNRPHLNKTQVKALKKGDRPYQGWEQDFLRTMDPQLGRPAPERLISIYNQVAQYNNTQAGIPG